MTAARKSKQQPSAAGKSKQQPSNGDDRRTRGGFVPSGVGEKRRQTHERRGNERGRQTRLRILDAAKRVFEANGFLDARVEDIIDAAGVPRGTFYTYFESKSHVFREVSSELGLLITAAAATMTVGDQGDGGAYRRLEQTVRRYLELYKNEAKMLGLLEQVSTIDEDVHNQRLDGRRRHVRRIANDIRRLQQHQVADGSLDPTTTAAALVSMLSNFAFWLYAGGDDSYDEETAVRTVTNIWAQTVGLALP